MKKTCVCCGYKTLDKSSIFDICPICFWEDEPNGRLNPEFIGGANGDVSLIQAQKNYISFGACEEVMLDVVRKPTIEDEFDSEWKPFMKKYSF